MISIKDLTVAYGFNTVLHNINLSISSGEIYGIVGLNGAGKTTLFNTIYGIKTPLSGSIKYNDSKISKKDITFLETENYYFSHITGYEYLSLFVKDIQIINEWNKLFNLPLDELIDTYSTGMRKKISILSVITQKKPLLILDEPFNGLDLQSSRTLSVIIKELSKNRTIIISSHILETVINICSTICYLKNGVVESIWDKNSFHLIEEKIFSVLDSENLSLIRDLIGQKH
ncbi:MAG TPA: ABC transporter ATP-binding protein [Ignavibacteriales bacterium]|nr:ABC transporter ATP-binding protein [Ignavibacteriales bacterium]